jgi:hypothetical protein
MKTLTYSLLASALLAIAIAAPSPANADNAVVVTTTKHHYMYYGDHDIYFAPERKTYYWQVDGKWQSGQELPVADRGYVIRGGVPIDLDTETPYERHEWVIAHYKNKHEKQEEHEEHH